jgi:hypothetical protein
MSEIPPGRAGRAGRRIDVAVREWCLLPITEDRC